MSRHRNVRSLNYEDEYDGYDDVYGHSVEDDYGVSPGTAQQYMFDRSGQHSLSTYMREHSEEQIAEEEEEEESESSSLQESSDFKRPKLSDIDEARLNSCLEEMLNIMGDSTPEHILIDAIVKNDFNYEKAINAILIQQEGPKPQRQKRDNRRNRDHHDDRDDQTVLPAMTDVENTNDSMFSAGTDTDTSNTDSTKKICGDHKGMLGSGKGPPPGFVQNQDLAAARLKGADLVKSSNISVADVARLEGIPLVQGHAQQAARLQGVDLVHSPSLVQHHYQGSDLIQKADVNLNAARLQGIGLIKGPIKREGLFQGAGLQQQNLAPLRHLVPNVVPNLQRSNPPRISLSSLANKQISVSPPRDQTTTQVSSQLPGSSASHLPPQHKEAGSGSSSLNRTLTQSIDTSLSDLAKQSKIKTNKTNTAEKPFPPGLQGPSLASLAKQYSSSPPRQAVPSLGGLAKAYPKQGSPVVNMSSSRAVASPPRSGVSLAALAAQHSTNATKSGTKQDKEQAVTLSELAARNSQDKNKSSSEEPEMAPIITQSNTSAPQAQTPSLAHLAAQHSVVPKGTHQPGFNVGQSSTPGSSGQSKPPPGFKPRQTVDLAALAARHQSQPNTTKTEIRPKGSTTKSASLISQLGQKTTVRIVVTKPSVFGRALCAKPTNCICNIPAQSASLTKFSYKHQISNEPGKESITQMTIVPFDFSTLSPDDVVKSKQKAAFNREARDKQAETASDTGVAATVNTIIPQPTAQGQQLPDTVTRMTFTSTVQAPSGFTPDKQDNSQLEANSEKVEAVKKDLNSLMDGATPVQGASGGRGNGDSVLFPPGGAVAESGMLTPKAGSRSASPAPRSATKSKQDQLNAKKELERRKAGGKAFINLVVIGHVDAGKSTLMGHVLYQLGFVNKRTMHKYEQESKKLGKASFAYAWVLDETEEERSRGVTMDVAQTRFETDTKMVTLLDAPGHKDFIPNMITGAAQADVAILVVNSTRGEFETGFEAGGQTREHAMLIRSLGVFQLVVAINKMDTVDWSEDRYKEITKKLGQFLRQAGFKESDVSYIPCSGLSGENLTKAPTEAKLSSWYQGGTVVQAIDKLKPPEREVDKPFRMCLSDVFKGMGAGITLAGNIQTGCVQTGDKVLIMPQAESASVKSITIDDAPNPYGFAGDNVLLVVTGIDLTNVSVGSILCDPSNPIRTTSRLKARVVVFNIDVPLTKGFPVVFHYQSLSEPAHIHKLISQLHKSTGEVIKKKPRCLTKNNHAVIELEINRPVCVELYKDFKDLGRFMLRYGGSTIAAGLVTEIKDGKAAKE